MCLAILAAYLPLQIFYLAVGVRETAAAYRPYDYARIHGEGSGPASTGDGDGDGDGATTSGFGDGNPYPWSAILFVPSWLVPGSAMNQPYIAIATTGVIFVFFGLGEEARETYRWYALKVGLGRWWPGLRRHHEGGGGGGGDEGERIVRADQGVNKEPSDSTLGYDTSDEILDIGAMVSRQESGPREQ